MKSWIKTLRTALSMSAEQFANRLGLTRARVNQLESSETHDAVILRTLKEAANALGCELVYAIVPKGNATLEDILWDYALHKHVKEAWYFCAPDVTVKSG